MIKVAILTISDKGAEGERVDRSGRVIMEQLADFGGQKISYDIIPDERKEIRDKIISICERAQADILFTTGGTGFASRDVTPEATLDVLEKEVPGIPEKIRYETGKITPRAYLSRGRAGIRGSTLIINLPGSPKAVKECLAAAKDIIPHGIDILKGNVTEH